MRGIILGLLLSSFVWSAEIGLRVGWATLSGKGEDYANVNIVSTPALDAGPQINLAYAKRTFFSTYC